VTARHDRVVGEQYSVLLVGDSSVALKQTLDAAGQLKRRQDFNLRAPIGFDLIDIATTVSVHFGLFYSVLFNYSGLFRDCELPKTAGNLD
jgi:hypothetical protein